MSVDLDHLLRDAGGDPGPLSDADEIWRKGRRRRRRRIVGASASGVVVVALLAVLPLSTGGGLQPVIEPMGQEGAAIEEGADGDGAAEEAGEDTAEAVEDPDLSDERAAEPEAPREAEGQQEVVAVAPDGARMAEPCAVHESREMRVFIDVVSPVDGQDVGSRIELVGCASVYEGTLQYRVVDGSGDVVLERFTTATAGGPEIGEFREVIDLPVSADDHYLEVYWEDPASGDEQHPDGPERDLVRIALGPR